MGATREIKELLVLISKMWGKSRWICLDFLRGGRGLGEGREMGSRGANGFVPDGGKWLHFVWIGGGRWVRSVKEVSRGGARPKRHPMAFGGRTTARLAAVDRRLRLREALVRVGGELLGMEFPSVLSYSMGRGASLK